MKERFTGPQDLHWKCRRCDVPLKIRPVTMAYMDQEFSAELARCPRCGFVLVSEELALGKMAEVEQILEDK